MQDKYELKEIDMKNCKIYCFDDVIIAWDIDIIDTDFSNFLLEEKLYKAKNEIFQLIAFHVKLQWLQNHYVLGAIIQMGLFRFMEKLLR